jgi:hypothetical protein
MIAVSRSLTSPDVSIVTVEAALSEEFGQNPKLPNWSPSFLPAANEAAAAKPVVDRLLIAMAGAGHSVAALSLYLGLKDSEVRERVAALNLPAASEKPLRRPVSTNPWSVQEVRRLIALWLDNVSVTSIAGALGRTPSSIRGASAAGSALACGCAKNSPTVRSLNAGRPHCRGSRRSTSNRSSAGFGRRGSARARRRSRARRLSQRSGGSWGAMLRRTIGFQPSGSRGSAPPPSPNGC